MTKQSKATIKLDKKTKRYVHSVTHFVFDKSSKKVTGFQNEKGELVALTEKQMRVCDKNDWQFDKPVEQELDEELENLEDDEEIELDDEGDNDELNEEDELEELDDDEEELDDNEEDDDGLEELDEEDELEELDDDDSELELS